MADIIKALEAKQNDKIPALKAGDNVSVHVKIKEGDRERVQEFKGIVIRMRKGGNDANITVRRMASNGIGVERTFLLRSPRIDKIVVEQPTFSVTLEKRDGAWQMTTNGAILRCHRCSCSGGVSR